MSRSSLDIHSLDRYRDHLIQEERAPATVEKYLRDAGAFAAWLEGRPVSRELVHAWKEALIAQGRTPATVNAKLAAVNGLLALLGAGRCRARYLKLQRRAFRDSARELTREEYQRLVDAARRGGQARLELLLETICATGIRVSELRYITVEAAGRGRAEVSLKGKVRVVLLPGKLCRKLLKYAQKHKIASGEVFLTRGGGSLSRKQIWREMKGLCARAGVEPTKVFPHNLRHLFATAFYQATRDIVRLADVLGHSSIDTTRIYLAATGEEHVRQLERLRLIS
ncbi:MAG: tyrosine-type recombinase/integrase [Oscillospiraceae bacterium]|nr:tyrosine-type recombinase/integrase [Oscillospiraceae bacterium]